MMNEERFQRQPSKELSISEITPDSGRVRIIGRVVGSDPGKLTLTLDDGTGAINVFFTEEEMIDKLTRCSVGDWIRVIGWPIDGQQGIEIRGEVMEKIDKIDPDLLVKVREIEKREE